MVKKKKLMEVPSNEKIIGVILKEITKDIRELNSPVPTFSFAYWKGYCNALEKVYSIQRDEIWKDLSKKSIKLCDDIKRKNQL